MVFQYAQVHRLGAYYAKELKNMFIQEIKKSYQLVVYLHRHRKDTQQEQQLTCEANKPSTMMPKLLVVLQIFRPNTSVQMVHEYIYVTFQGMIKEITLTEIFF